MPGDQRPPGPLRLKDKWLEFIGEGSANTIWAVHFTSPSGGDAETQALRKACNGFLLRIQKHQSTVKGAADASYTAKEQLAYLTTAVQPLFRASPSLIVSHALIPLSQPLIDEANAVLAQLDEKRAAHDAGSKPEKHPHLPLRGRKFAGSRVGPAGTHMLTEDFRPRRPSERFAEIKPKWLAQSPTAPPGADTCRNCAVAAKRFAAAPEGKKPAKSDPATYGCPLHLVAAGEAADWKAQAERIFRGREAAEAHFLFKAVRRHHVLRHLRALQVRFARGDTLLTTREGGPDMDVLLAMTLRDCSLFFRYEVLDATEGGKANGKVNGGGGRSGKRRFRLIDFKLADLDRKTPRKIPSWQETERELIDGGWYQGKKSMPHCLLKRAARCEETVDESKLKDPKALGVVYEE